MKNAKQVEESLAYWKNKAKEIRRDPSIFGPAQLANCQRNIRQLTEHLKALRAASAKAQEVK